MEEDRALTYGEKLVGLNFNPSGDARVTVLKQAFSRIIDMCNDSLEGADDTEQALWLEAIRKSLAAQMWCVKAATWRK